MYPLITLNLFCLGPLFLLFFGLIGNFDSSNLVYHLSGERTSCFVPDVCIVFPADLCLKWRVLPFATSNIGKTFPDNWVCSMNVDPSHNRCSTAEQKLNITEGVLKKEVKSAEQKQEELEKEIQKKQEQLNKMQVCVKDYRRK